MFKIILLMLFFISTVIVKLLSTLLPINGQTSGEIFNRLPVFFTPANYVFYIWIVIFHLISLVDLEYDEGLQIFTSYTYKTHSIIWGIIYFIYFVYI